MAQIKVGSKGFVYVDIDGAPRASGIVRVAKKILAEGAVSLARHTTYSYAACGIAACGASGGVSFGTDERSASIDQFVADWTQLGRDDIDVSGPDALSTLGRSTASQRTHEDSDRLLVASTIATAQAWLGTLVDRSAAVTGASSTADVLRASLEALGVRLVDRSTARDRVDVAFLGGGTGELHHLNVEEVGADVVVGFVPNSVTARGLATAKRAGTVVLPDFVATCGLVATSESTAPMDEQVATVERLVVGHLSQIDRSSDAGPFLESCFVAERHMSTWASALPFGRPLA